MPGQTKHREQVAGIAADWIAPTSFMASRHVPFGAGRDGRQGNSFPPQIHRSHHIRAGWPIKQLEPDTPSSKGEHWTPPPPGKSKYKMKKTKQLPVLVIPFTVLGAIERPQKCKRGFLPRCVRDNQRCSDAFQGSFKFRALKEAGATPNTASLLRASLLVLTATALTKKDKRSTQKRK